MVAASPYASLGARWLLGAGAHPGGAALTREAVRRLGLPRAARLADLGCGTGHSTVLLARAGARVDAVDVDPRAVRLARARARAALVADRVGVTEADLHHLPLPAGRYAGVLIECVASTLTDPAQVLARAAALLRPSGRLALTDVTLDREGLADLYPGLLADVDALTTARPLEGWAALVAGAGFTVDEAEDRRAEARALCRRLELRLPTRDLRARAGAATAAVEEGLLSYGLVLATVA